jgi:phage FluMu protein Com
MPSARWAISCRNCKKAFAHAEVSEPQGITDSFGLPDKPEFPVGGKELECPHCKSKDTYQRTDLWYQAAANGAL